MYGDEGLSVWQLPLQWSLASSSQKKTTTSTLKCNNPPTTPPPAPMKRNCLPCLSYHSIICCFGGLHPSTKKHIWTRSFVGLNGGGWPHNMSTSALIMDHQPFQRLLPHSSGVETVGIWCTSTLVLLVMTRQMSVRTFCYSYT
jgi:hypothetical protein